MLNKIFFAILISISLITPQAIFSGVEETDSSETFYTEKRPQKEEALPNAPSCEALSPEETPRKNFITYEEESKTLLGWMTIAALDQRLSCEKWHPMSHAQVFLFEDNQCHLVAEKLNKLDTNNEKLMNMQKSENYVYSKELDDKKIRAIILGTTEQDLVEILPFQTIHGSDETEEG